MNKRKVLYVMVAAILAACMGLMAQSPNSGLTLEGAWNVSLAFDQSGLPPCAPCAPAPTVATASAPGRGTLIADSCWASEGAGYGVWAGTGGNQFGITFMGNSFGPLGTVTSSYRVRAMVSLDTLSNAFQGPFETQIFDLQGNVLATLTGRVSAVRIAL
jgi:hypothetical protein